MRVEIKNFFWRGENAAPLCTQKRDEQFESTIGELCQRFVFDRRRGELRRDCFGQSQSIDWGLCVCRKRRHVRRLLHECVTNRTRAACRNSPGPRSLCGVLMESFQSLLGVSSAANRIGFIRIECNDLPSGGCFATRTHEQSLHLPCAGLCELFGKLFWIRGRIECLEDHSSGGLVM